jgi:hypothetical protein
MSSEVERWKTKKSLAERYSVTERTITNWMRRRLISFVKIGRAVRFDPQTTDRELKAAGEIPSFAP